MILLFDPAPPCLQWCLVRNGVAAVQTVEARGNWPQKIMESLDGGDPLEAIGYVLHNGGDQIRDAVSLLSQETLLRLTNSVQLLPEHNSLTRKVTQYWMEQRPAIPHFLFCDTAFFTHLPPFVRDYAVPYALTQKGLHRYGGFGLCHEWTWKKIRIMTAGTTRQVIQIYLGNRTNLAAIRDGKPAETTVGFTHLEGVMSSEGCGDIDPTILFQLKADGFSYSTINRMLSTQSGFTALAGRPCNLSDILDKTSNPDLAPVRRVFLYQVVKYVGALLAVLGGADTLVFIGAQPMEIMPLVREVCGALDFLGIRLQSETGHTGCPQQVSTEGSALKIMISAYDQWRMMDEWIRSLINKKEDKMKTQQKKFLVDVGMRDLPFPVKVMSRSIRAGQSTVAGISISARIMREFDARWIDTFIQIVHQHRDRIGTATLKQNIADYIKALQASTVTVSFEFPFFYEKLTPVSHEKCLVRYLCVYTVKGHSAEGTPKATLRVNVPILTTYPMSSPESTGGLFGQLSIITLDVEPRDEVFPEDLIDVVDQHALAPIYSFLTADDQRYVIQKVHSENKPSVVVVDKIKEELANNKNIEWYAVASANYGMLHSYSTLIGTEKNLWVPFSSYEHDEP